ncbi:hypothetical protein KY289_011190 [Solanum tuberosum]|nr:hypothetical protein KY289_011190 [Solanum tuberosum]
MSPIHKLYFGVVHKIILQRKLRWMQANFLDLTLMELLDDEMASIFEAFDVPVQVWVPQTVKGVIGRVNHMALPVSMRRLDSPLQRLKDQLAEKELELAAVDIQF